MNKKPKINLNPSNDENPTFKITAFVLVILLAVGAVYLLKIEIDSYKKEKTKIEKQLEEKKKIKKEQKKKKDNDHLNIKNKSLEQIEKEEKIRLKDFKEDFYKEVKEKKEKNLENALMNQHYEYDEEMANLERKKTKNKIGKIISDKFLEYFRADTLNNIEHSVKVTFVLMPNKELKNIYIETSNNYRDKEPLLTILKESSKLFPTVKENMIIGFDITNNYRKKYRTEKERKKAEERKSKNYWYK